MIDWHKDIDIFVIALVGVLLGGIMNPPVPWSWREFFIGALASLFFGCLTLMLCRGMGLDDYYAGAATGFVTWLGAEKTRAIVAAILSNKLGINVNAQITGEGHKNGD